MYCVSTLEIQMMKQESRASEESRDDDDPQMGDSNNSTHPTVPAHAKENEKKLVNRFKFSERSSLTIKKACKDKEIQADPPLKLTFSTNANQWEIYDAYLKDIKKQEKAKEKKNIEESNILATEIEAVSDSQATDLSSLLHVAKVVERMVSQNVYNDITLDFKLWEDPSDEYRVPQGSVLPLWKFFPYHSICKTVTALSWNPKYPDLFAAAFGSYTISDQSSGYICLFSLKCPSAAEKVYETETGIFCMDFHQEIPHLLAVGMANGSVAVYSLRRKENKALYEAEDISEGHLDPVWKVEWFKNQFNLGKRFASISGDGTVNIWTTVKATLKATKLISLKTGDIWTEVPPCMRIELICCGTNIALRQTGKNPGSEFLVGTEQGSIQLCSILYTNKIRRSYQGHSGVVQQLQWNYFHPDIFLSCSSDWMVYMWEVNCKKPILSFDLKCEVNDVAWAPYSATLFAALTSDGKIHIYDVSVDRYQPICQQKVLTRKATATKLSFNLCYPILIVGCDSGQIYSVKLSPNLRMNLTVPHDLKDAKFHEIEKARMHSALEKAMALVTIDS